MAIALEAWTVVARRSSIEQKVEGGLEQILQISAAMAWHDEDLFAHSFMVEGDAFRFMEQLNQQGLEHKDTADPDLILFCCEDQSVEPWCEWFRHSPYAKAQIGWLEGSKPEKIYAPNNWSPDEEPKIQFHDREQFEKEYEWVEEKDGVETFQHRETGKKVYIGRTSQSPAERWGKAGKVIGEHLVAPGQKPLQGEPAEHVRAAVDELESMIAESNADWRCYFFAGKGQIALGDYAKARQWLETAMEQVDDVESVARELGGVCLVLGDGAKAVEVAQKAASLRPDDAESIGNLAVAYLVNGQQHEAEKTIQAALKLDPNDEINANVSKMVAEVRDGERPAPKNLRDLMTPRPKAKKAKGLLGFLKKLTGQKD